MIREEEIINIGRITKSRGIRGEVEMRFTDDVFDRGDSEYFVLHIDGIPVPFFWEEYKFKNSDTAILKLERVDKDEQARRLVGCRVSYPVKHVPASEEERGLASWQALEGYSVSHADGRHIGVIETVDDSTANVLLYLRTPEGREVILPIHEDFVTHLSPRDHTLRLDLPEGLTDL